MPLKCFLQRGIFCATCKGPLISIISRAARFTTAGERYLLLRCFRSLCVRSVVPKQLYLNPVWSQMCTFVVYSAVSVLVTFIIFCKGDQQPPLPDSSSLSHLGNNICYCLNIPTTELHSHVCGCSVCHWHVQGGTNIHLSCHCCGLSSAQWALTNRFTYIRVCTKLTRLPPSSWRTAPILLDFFPISLWM